MKPIKPGCAQHDCDKCKERAELLTCIMERMSRLMEIECYSFKGEANWKEVGTLAREVNRMVRKQQS